MELLQRDPAFPQWTRAKNFDFFGVFGPVVATDLDPGTLTVRTLVNGRERQNYRVDDMIFPAGRAGQPPLAGHDPGAGRHHRLRHFMGVLPMKAGTTVEIAIEGIGTLRNQYG